MSSLDLTKITTGDASMEFLCELCDAQAACGRYFVFELASEVNSKMTFVTKILAMPGTTTAVADLCMFGLAACDEGGPGFQNASAWTVTNARQVGMRMQRECTGTLWVRTAQARKWNKQEHGYIKIKLPEQWRNS